MLAAAEMLDTRSEDLANHRITTGRRDRSENIFDVVRTAEREFITAHNAASVQKQFVARLKRTALHAGLSAEEPHARRERLQRWKHLRIVGIEDRNILARLVFEETKLRSAIRFETTVAVEM